VGSTVRGIRGPGRSDATRFGGIPPSEIARLWPVCAHRASLKVHYPKLQITTYQGLQGISRVHTVVSPSTSLAPDSSSLRAPTKHRSMVIRSSTSKTHLLSTWLLRRVAKVPRTDSTLLKTKDLLRSWPCPHQHHCLTRQTKRSGQRLGDGPELAIARAAAPNAKEPPAPNPAA